MIICFKITTYTVRVVTINRCHGNVVKGFWALRDNTYVYVCLLL